MRSTCSLHSYEGVKPPVYDFAKISAPNSNRQHAVDGVPSGMFEIWIREALKKSGLTQAELARQVSDRIGSKLDRAQVNKLAKGTRTLLADEMLAIAEIAGHPLPAEQQAAPLQVDLRALSEMMATALEIRPAVITRSMAANLVDALIDAARTGDDARSDPRALAATLTRVLTREPQGR